MGNSNSAALESPLQEPQGSMKALDGSSIAEQPTTLRVKASSLRTRATVTDLETNSTIGLFKGKMFSSRVVLETPQGQIIASISNKTFSSKYRVFQGDETDDPSFMIQDASGFFKTMVLVAEFTDTETGTPCRVVVRGSPSTKVVLCHLERGGPTLSQLQKGNDFLENQGRYQRVGRIRRKSYFGGDDYFIEATAGVDLTVLLLIWHVRHVRLVAERANASS
ncbi:hypothetical protein PHYSODRAFT_247045 [Phytophthora sojae]|uniref:Tubby C-terminal domain-containing protein n=1 Tax=Phytophthora sojae (strain P6497) TaxID=1094619 RepID=G4Z9L8_PHYSP|nr:hypothetical protein PHYSODRAFT_247045 [Phytophthora sojae]EGZ19132.1 hypothetical protein PHYSODRAFT_247045 [Phytophthora sojae]|eukprot:XP_009521849.1 hypothetical protein PHYSODRAFT_247045 [Phytophthora sojae]